MTISKTLESFNRSSGIDYITPCFQPLGYLGCRDASYIYTAAHSHVHKRHVQPPLPVRCINHVHNYF